MTNVRQVSELVSPLRVVGLIDPDDPQNSNCKGLGEKGILRGDSFERRFA